MGNEVTRAPVSDYGRRLVVRVQAFTGWDGVLYALAQLIGARALRWFARHCARKCLRPGAPFHGMDLRGHTVVLELPYGAFRVTKPDGTVEPYHDIAPV